MIIPKRCRDLRIGNKIGKKIEGPLNGGYDYVYRMDFSVEIMSGCGDRRGCPRNRLRCLWYVFFYLGVTSVNIL